MYWKKWFKATLIRMIRTFAQVFLASVITLSAFHEVDWMMTLSKSLFATLICFLMCLKNNLPELKTLDIGDSQDEEL